MLISADFQAGRLCKPVKQCKQCSQRSSHQRSLRECCTCRDWYPFEVSSAETCLSWSSCCCHPVARSAAAATAVAAHASAPRFPRLPVGLTKRVTRRRTSTHRVRMVGWRRSGFSVASPQVPLKAPKQSARGLTRLTRRINADTGSPLAILLPRCNHTTPGSAPAAHRRSLPSHWQNESRPCLCPGRLGVVYDSRWACAAMQSRAWPFGRRGGDGRLAACVDGVCPSTLQLRPVHAANHHPHPSPLSAPVAGAEAGCTKGCALCKNSRWVPEGDQRGYRRQRAFCNNARFACRANTNVASVVPGPLTQPSHVRPDPAAASAASRGTGSSRTSATLARRTAPPARTLAAPPTASPASRATSRTTASACPRSHPAPLPTGTPMSGRGPTCTARPIPALA